MLFPAVSQQLGRHLKNERFVFYFFDECHRSHLVDTHARNYGFFVKSQLLFYWRHLFLLTMASKNGIGVNEHQKDYFGNRFTQIRNHRLPFETEECTCIRLLNIWVKYKTKVVTHYSIIEE